MFSCCTNAESEVYYQLERKDEHNRQSLEYFNHIDDIDPKILSDQHYRITKVKKSGFEEAFKQIQNKKEKFTDQEFPPVDASIGNAALNPHSWKRISQLIRKPTLFDDLIQPRDVIHNNVGDCYFLSSLAALAEDPSIIKNIFRNQKYNEEGIYKVTLRVNGVVEEVVVDDFIPVNQHNAPIYCQPNKNGEFWALILEKALAKVNGSYAGIEEGIPSDVFKAVTYAPSESLLFTDSASDKEKIWNIILESTKNFYPICANTKDTLPESVHLTKAHTYTIVSSGNLTTRDGHHIEVVRLRDPWTEVHWQGKANEKDSAFWETIVENEEKERLFRKTVADYGLFYMTFEDFLHSFNQIHYCNINSHGKFISEPLTVNKKNGSLFQLSIQKEEVYSLELNQSLICDLKEEQKSQNVCRATLLLIRHIKGEEERFEFVNGVMKYTEANMLLTEKLTPGEYLVFAKIDPTRLSNKIPEITTLSIFSQTLTKLTPVLRTKYPNILQKTFLDQGEHNKKMIQNDGKMWLSWKLLYQQGGYAYIALGNDKNSDSAFVITFSQDEFKNMDFKLKKDFKGKGSNQILKVLPGEKKIILARIINKNLNTVKFPPPMDIKIQPL